MRGLPPVILGVRWILQSAFSGGCLVQEKLRGSFEGKRKETLMHGGIRYLLVGAAAVTLAGTAIANSDLAKLEADSNNWAAQSGDFALSRHSKLNQINKSNVHKLQVAWTFSTGVLRGHEGGPLVIGNVMYVHGPFPNPVYALDLNNDAKILR